MLISPLVPLKKTSLTCENSVLDKDEIDHCIRNLGFPFEEHELGSLFYFSVAGVPLTLSPFPPSCAATSALCACLRPDLTQSFCLTH